ncbi:nitric oxide reductase activation protein NorD [Gordonia rhizosphera]|uniref:VWFA domain-containing protein n=1 Tax=Gordonia rhizosphera NBRC 16068 TaxID=1108045 RepID=K6X533_9ACTN|nr:VWA domain-containing protein [Gordonia rhizosphera]GAB93894.1 hypothetical protein GORHZ_247_00320 [Gordonia rhizosphera NBRC 16068]
MNESGPVAPERFRLLAGYLAGRSIDVAVAAAGVPAHTDGQVVFVSAGGSAEQQRREVIVQAALIGAGSLDRRLVKSLRGHPPAARRYVALEGHRVLDELAARLPLAASIGPDAAPITATADESLDMARGRTHVDDPPEWYGAIKPSKLLGSSAGPGARASDEELRLQFHPIDLPESDDDDDEDAQELFENSKILRLFENPVVNSRMISDFLRKMFGGRRSESSDAPGGELAVRSLRRMREAGPDARPLPSHIRFADGDRPGAAVGVGGALHPEWDVFGSRYRADWCRVIDFPLMVPADVSSAGIEQDDVLRRRLSRVGLGRRVVRRSPDGDDLDVEALIDLAVDLRSGHSPSENVYTDRRLLARELGVLILVDASGSATDTDSDGLAVHDHQRRAAATLAATLEELGDRVAVYAFRSHGRHAVHLPAIKNFGQPFGAIGRARINQLRPSGYTRLGAGIRGAGTILKQEAGTPNKLLLVLSDGFPYDDGYEGRYAEADAHRALEELRADGVACLCLSLGAATDTASLERVFGSASHASAANLAALSPRMDELFLSSLRELAAPRRRAPRTKVRP